MPVARWVAAPGAYEDRRRIATEETVLSPKLRPDRPLFEKVFGFCPRGTLNPYAKAKPPVEDLCRATDRYAPNGTEAPACDRNQQICPRRYWSSAPLGYGDGG